MARARINGLPYDRTKCRTRGFSLVGVGQSREVARVETGCEAVHGVTSARLLCELARERHDLLPEVGRALPWNARMAEDRAESVSLVRRDRLRSGYGEGIGVNRRRVLAGTAHDTDLEHARGAAEVALLDRPDPSGAYDLEHPRVDENVDVVSDGALRTSGRGCELRDGRGALEQEVKDGRPQWMRHRAKLRGRRDDHAIDGLVVGFGTIDRHLWNDLIS